MIWDKKVRDNKKTEFYRKMGLIKINKARLIMKKIVELKM